MAVSVQRAVDDILECPICLETTNDTRVLPCIHTFCLKCIQKHGNDNKRGDQISCPCCRKSCPVPAGGFGELPKNILLEKLLEIRTSLAETTASDLQCSNGNSSCTMTPGMNSSRLCQIPSHGGKGNSSLIANSYCTECMSYMCSDCWKGHTKQSGTGSHRVLPIGCSEHSERSLEFYCKTCKIPICDACSSSNHKRHKCSSLSAMSGYVNSLQSEIKSLKSQIFHKEALERENQTLKSQIFHKEALECENKTLKSQIFHKEALERENQTLKSQIAEIKRTTREIDTLKTKFAKIAQLESHNANQRSKLTEYQREIEILKAKEALVGKLKKEVESLKTEIAELSQQKKSTAPTQTEFHHISSLKSNDCRVHSCEQVMLMCRGCKNELCLNCFRLGMLAQERHKDGAISLLLLILVIMTAAFIYVSRSS